MEKVIGIRKKTNQVAVLNYVRAIYDFGFFTFMIPFRVTWREDRGYTLYSNRVQKIISGFIQLLIIYETTTYLILALRKDVLETAFHYMMLAHIAGCLMFRISCIRMFFCRRKTLLDLLQKIENLKFLTESTSVSRKVNLVAYGMMTWTFCFAISELLNVNLGLTSQSYMGGNFRKLEEEAHVLYLHRDISADSRIGDLNLLDVRNGTSFMEVLATSIHAIGIFPHYICMNSLDKNILTVALMGRHIVLDFLKFSKKHESDMNLVFRQYEAMKEVISAINDTFGLLTLALVVVCLPFYPTWTGIVVLKEEQNLYQIFQFICFFGTFFLVLGIAADLNSKVGEFYKWTSSLSLSKGAAATGITPEKLAALSIDMYSEQIAIMGGGFFNITYRFLGTVLSVIVTYTVIIVQFQNTKA